MIVDTEAAVALGSGRFAEAFVDDDALPGVPWLPIATAGPAAFDRRFNNSVTKPAQKPQLTTQPPTSKTKCSYHAEPMGRDQHPFL